MNRLGYNRVFGGGGGEAGEGLALAIGGVLIVGLAVVVISIPFAVVESINNAKEIKNTCNETYSELAYVLSEKEVEGIEKVNGVENCVFNLNDNTLTILADVDTVEKDSVTFAYEYQMSESLYQLVDKKGKNAVKFSTDKVADGYVMSDPDGFKDIVDEVVDVSKGEISLTYECSEEQVKTMEKLVLESKEEIEKKSQLEAKR